MGEVVTCPGAEAGNVLKYIVWRGREEEAEAGREINGPSPARSLTDKEINTSISLLNNPTYYINTITLQTRNHP
ncbi:hypothetical protein Pmani_010595 [Petrolisthes manimaculis]|uniref:Uncharacterized protein n=1 Tax=Petrolisthes manimaculis TaxID=1843537 RepID=A0AAE1Q2S7_9EUCA|nr:hypothetical protein Pmani_010595 [Petrolisthes manimaculis]